MNLILSAQCLEIYTTSGKVDVTGTVKNFLSGRKLLSCNYDELSENNLLNQILKTTAITS